MRQLCISIIVVLCFTLNVNGQIRTHNSWQDPVVLCAAEDFSWKILYPVLDIDSEQPESCIKPFENLNSIWFRFRVENQSLLSFSIKPNTIENDIDFAIYSSIDGTPIELLRCMSTGVNLDKSRSTQIQCTGQTGLTQNETDMVEDPGCGSGHNNFLRSIESQKGQEFLLEITNYKSSDGFTFHWTGNSILSSDLCNDEKLNGETIRINASPNPASDLINYTIFSSQAGAATIRFFNSNGNIVEQEEAILIAGSNDFSTASKNFTPGTYYINSVLGELKSETVKIEIVR